MKKSFALIIVCNIFQGCSLFTNPMEQPVIEERLNQTVFKAAPIGTLSLTPERRVVLVNFKNNRFCAEAPTEIGIDTAHLNEIKAAIQQAGKTSADIDAIFEASTANTVLNKRTQGMQLFLANSYFTCQMYMNNAISKKEMLEMQIRTLEAVKPLIQYELYYQNQYLMPSREEKHSNHRIIESTQGVMNQPNNKPEPTPKAAAISTFK